MNSWYAGLSPSKIFIIVFLVTGVTAIDLLVYVPLCLVQERKTTRQQLVRRIRHIAGDKILLCAIKSIRVKVCLLSYSLLLNASIRCSDANATS